MNSKKKNLRDKANPKDLIGDRKPPLHLVPPALEIYVSMVMKLGAKKYGPYNWRKNKVRRTVYISAAMRHLKAALDGEDADHESKMPHEANAAACMAILLDALATGNLIDDRPTPGASARLIREFTEQVAPETRVAKKPRRDMSLKNVSSYDTLPHYRAIFRQKGFRWTGQDRVPVSGEFFVASGNLEPTFYSGQSLSGFRNKKRWILAKL